MLTEYGRQTALAQLLAELLFQRGQECAAVELLPLLYEEHFGVPLVLLCFQVESVAELLELPEIKSVVQVRMTFVYVNVKVLCVSVRALGVA